MYIMPNLASYMQGLGCRSHFQMTELMRQLFLKVICHGNGTPRSNGPKQVSPGESTTLGTARSQYRDGIRRCCSHCVVCELQQFVVSTGRIPPGLQSAMTGRNPTLGKALPAGRAGAGESGREQGSECMNKADIAGRLAGSTGLGKAQAAGAVEAVFAAIGEALAEGEDVRVAGFGTFAVKNRPARAGRNPRTGEAVSIPASTVASFKAAKALRDAVNGG